MLNKKHLLPVWPAPANIQCLVTTQESLNLALHVGDDAEKVKFNRQQLQADIGLSSIQWLQQVHSPDVFICDSVMTEPVPRADSLYSTSIGLGCGVLTADCLPVFFCDRQGEEVAVAHAGWRGLLAGVLENTLNSFQAEPDDILAWLGPAIGPCHFEIGAEVRQAFLDKEGSSDFDSAFTPSIPTIPTEIPNKWMADLYQLATLILNAHGIRNVYGGGECTYCNESDFYSYRRNKNTGRFASIIWKV